MRNVKDQVYAALSQVFENVSDQYPKDWADLPAVQYMEEDNKVMEHSMSGGRPQEDASYVRYGLDIWNNRSTSAAALAADEAMSSLGLVRTLCKDVADPSGMKHKTMKYEGIIDMRTDNVYWTD
jgi:hypothetical protein